MFRMPFCNLSLRFHCCRGSCLSRRHRLSALLDLARALRGLSTSTSLATLTAMSIEQTAQNHTFGGTITKYKTVAKSLGGLETNFNVFLPEEASNGPVPCALLPGSSCTFIHKLILDVDSVLYYLAGLTCNEDTAYVPLSRVTRVWWGLRRLIAQPVLRQSLEGWILA